MTFQDKLIDVVKAHREVYDRRLKRKDKTFTRAIWEGVRKDMILAGYTTSGRCYLPLHLVLHCNLQLLTQSHTYSSVCSSHLTVTVSDMNRQAKDRHLDLQ